MSKKSIWREKDKELVHQIVKRLMEVLSLDLWTISLIFEEENHPSGDAYIATSDILYQYSKSDIRLYPQFLKDLKMDDLQEVTNTLMHELLHCYTHDLYIKAGERFTTDESLTEANEKLVQSLTMICTRMLKNQN